MKTTYLGAYTIPDGYFGATAIAHFCYDPDSQKTLAVHPFGFHSTFVPLAMDYKEAEWLLKNHPHTKIYKKIV